MSKQFGWRKRNLGTMPKGAETWCDRCTYHIAGECIYNTNNKRYGIFCTVHFGEKPSGYFPKPEYQNMKK